MSDEEMGQGEAEGERKPKITKAWALEQFIQDRLLGDLPVARTAHGRCVYDPRVNGGCAIGRMLDLVGVPYDERWEGATVNILLKTFPGLSEYFEEPDSMFWTHLQLAHDSGIDGDIDGEWQAELRTVAELVEKGR